MVTRLHKIIVGRTSRAIAEGLAERFGLENIIQSRFGTFADGESNFELFLEGTLPDHPLEQCFSNAEKTQIRAGLSGAHITIVHSVSGPHSSSRAMALLDCVQYLKQKCGVASITVIAPHIAYTRQDREFSKIEIIDNHWEMTSKQYNAVTNENFARRLRLAGADRFVGVDFHSRDAESHYQQAFSQDIATVDAIDTLVSRFTAAAAKTAGSDLFGLDPAEIQILLRLLDKIDRDTLGNQLFGAHATEFLSPEGILLPEIKERFPLSDYAGRIGFLSPDGADKPGDLGVGRARRIADGYYDMPAGTPALEDHPHMGGIVKRRISAVKTIIDKSESFVGNLKDRIVFAIDDIASSGGTQKGAGGYLKEEAGIAALIAWVTHAVLPGQAIEAIALSPEIDEFWAADTVPGLIDDKLARLPETLPPLIREQLGPDAGDETVQAVFEKAAAKFKVISASPIILDAVERDHALRPGLRWAAQSDLTMSPHAIPQLTAGS